MESLANNFDRSSTWKDVKWLVDKTNLPVIAKGILRGDDAIRAIEAGCQAIIVSNHGGRNLDTTPATVGNRRNLFRGKSIFSSLFCRLRSFRKCLKQLVAESQ